jgi:DNA-directed RNA polymerase II subunit RPB2
MSVFYALGVTNDRDLYDTILAGLPESEKETYDGIFAELVMSHKKFTDQEMTREDDDQDPDLSFLARQTRTRSEAGVFMNLMDDMFPHCEHGESKMRRKSYLLGHMTRMAMDVALGITKQSDRDHFRFKRLDSSGELCFQEFRRVFKEVSKSMLTKLDSMLHYQTKSYEGTKFPELVQEERIGSLWRSFTFMSEFEKSFKKQWGGKDGISQELSRLAYLGSVAHLRRVNLQMDKGTKVVEPRRIHGSTWGLMCPTDNPDGRNIGMIKSMALFCTLSTASPATQVIQWLNGMHMVPLHLIHPSTWNPAWTKVFVNSDLIGVLTNNDTETVHEMMVTFRRNGDFPSDVSLSWNRQKNEYNIFTDAGRPIRPVYREGVGPSQIKQTQTWTEMRKNLFDYLDAQETDTIRISMEPFSKTLLSEIHGLAMFSASASVIPHSDFNQAPRNMFSCQQTKQATSWYNTAFNKRFDTIATWLNYAQRPLSTTWTYNQMLGCLPYGENAIVALAIYSGYNQEDSILLNDTALKRGLFHTTYYHSYDVSEKMIDPAVQTHTEFGNVSTNAKYRDTVSRKEGYNYDLLDGDGIIREGVMIDDKTVLAGIVSPILNNGGQVVGYADSSYVPKRGQHGIIDSVYRYVTKEGLLGIKVRIAESRIPVLGDKYSARHGQKGTVGMRIPEEDMPYTSTGLRPDMIVNPHAFPSRMTIGQFAESMTTKLGVHMGCSVDATPFSSQNRVPETKMLLEKAGFHPYGHEILYNGHTGEMIEAEIFMGPTYYLRLKHMVEDKLNYRSTGPKKLLTHQPTDGRANEGGLRIGEMERDVLIAHGASKFLHESMMERSDGATLLMDPATGRLDAKADTETIKMSFPYSVGVLVKELEANHLSVQLISS